MLKFIFVILFMTPICFSYNMFWMVQVMLFLISFLFILFNNFGNYFSSMSYFMGVDVLSWEEQL